MEKKTTQDITNAIGDDVLSFSSADFNVFQQDIEIREQFDDITVICQPENTDTISMMVPTIVHMARYLKQMNSETSLLKRLVSQLDQSINAHFSRIVKRLSLQSLSNSDLFSDPLYFAVTLLDPKFKL